MTKLYEGNPVAAIIRRTNTQLSFIWTPLLSKSPLGGLLIEPQGGNFLFRFACYRNSFAEAASGFVPASHHQLDESHSLSSLRQCIKVLQALSIVFNSSL